MVVTWGEDKQRPRRPQLEVHRAESRAGILGEGQQGLEERACMSPLQSLSTASYRNLGSRQLPSGVRGEALAQMHFYTPLLGLTVVTDGVDSRTFPITL